jgi:hypothetical protein
MKKPFWHRISDTEIKSLIEAGKTNAFVMENYRQPTWCGYHEALNGSMGCWSLTDNFGSRKSISKKFCANCDCFKNNSIKPCHTQTL